MVFDTIVLNTPLFTAILSTVGIMKEETLEHGEIAYTLVWLPQYQKELKKYSKTDAGLHSLVLETLQSEIESGKFTVIAGTGGWIKTRVSSPANNMGKSGAYRMIYIYFKVHRTIFLQSIYSKRVKADLSPKEKTSLAAFAKKLKLIYKNTAFKGSHDS